MRIGGTPAAGRLRRPVLKEWITPDVMLVTNEIEGDRQNVKSGDREAVSSSARPDASSLYKTDLDRHLFSLADEEEKLKEVSDALLELLEAIPEKLRETFLLREHHGLSYREIGLRLDIPVGTVKSRLHRIRKLLKDRRTDA